MIDKRERCALALRAYQQRTGMSQTQMAIWLDAHYEQVIEDLKGDD